MTKERKDKGREERKKGEKFSEGKRVEHVLYKKEEQVTILSGLLKDAGHLMPCGKKKDNILSKLPAIHLGR